MKLLTHAIMLTALTCVLIGFGCEETSTPTAAPMTDEEADMELALFGAPPEIIELGSIDINGTILIVTMTGTVASDEGLSLELTHTDGPKPTIMKAWVGTESGEGSNKDTGHSHGDELPIIWHTYAECPTAMTDDMQLWIELTYEDGTNGTGELTIQES
jgi:hypothetical protein